MDEWIGDFMRDLRSADWLTSEQRSWVPYLFHFTRLENVPSILQDGLLSSRERLKVLNSTFANTANPEILLQTDERVHHHARLYFRPRVPMLYQVEGVQPSLPADTPHCPVPVYFIFDAASVLSQEDVLVSQGNCSVKAFPNHMAKPREVLPTIPFELVYHNSRLTQEDKARVLFHRQAEVLVKGALKLDSLRWIYVRSEAELSALRMLTIEKDPVAWERFEDRVVVDTRMGLFFNRWMYLRSVKLVDNRLLLDSNPDAVRLGPFQLSMLLSDGHIEKSAIIEDFDFPSSGVKRFKVPKSLHGSDLRTTIRLDGFTVFCGLLRDERTTIVSN